MSSRAEARRAKRDTLGWDRALVACYDSTGMRVRRRRKTLATATPRRRLTPIHDPVVDTARRVLNPLICGITRSRSTQESREPRES